MTRLLLRPKIHLFSVNHIVKKINYHLYLHPDVKKNLSGLKKKKNFVFLFLGLAIIRKLRHRFAAVKKRRADEKDIHHTKSFYHGPDNK